MNENLCCNVFFSLITVIVTNLPTVLILFNLKSYAIKRGDRISKWFNIMNNKVHFHKLFMNSS